MAEAMESEALREVRRRREEREAGEEASPSDWDLVEEAVEKKEWEVVRWIVRQGTIGDIDKRRGPDEKTLMHDACHDGDLETVKMLRQEMRANVGLRDKKKVWGAVHWAAAAGHVDVVHFLLRGGGANINSRTGSGDRALHVGAHSLPVVQCLVEECGADLEAKGSSSETALHRAACDGNVSCLRYLLEKGARLDALASGHGILDFAARAESTEALRYLVEECGCDPLALEKERQTRLLSTAVRRDSLEFLRYLVEECGVALGPGKVNGGALLREAAEGGFLALGEYLVQQHGVSVEDADCFGWRPLHKAADRGDLAMVKWLVQQCGANVEAPKSDGGRPLHVAVWAGAFPVVKWLLEEGGADVNALDSRAVHMVAERGMMECLRYLVEEADADVLVRDHNGQLPSDVAIRYEKEEAAAFLKEAEEMAQMKKNPV